MKHEISVERSDDLYLAFCTCGWRGEKWRGRQELAVQEADDHEQQAKNLLLNSGPKPSLKTLAKEYRRRSKSNVYNERERDQWEALAVEIEAELLAQQNVIEGQTELF